MTAIQHKPRAQIETDRPSILLPSNPQSLLNRSHDILGSSLLPKSLLKFFTNTAFLVRAVSSVAALRTFNRISGIAAMTFPIPGETVCHRRWETGGDDIVAAARSLVRVEVVIVSIYVLLLPHGPNLKKN